MNWPLRTHRVSGLFGMPSVFIKTYGCQMTARASEAGAADAAGCASHRRLTAAVDELPLARRTQRLGDGGGARRLDAIAREAEARRARRAREHLR